VKLDNYDIEIIVQGFPGKAVCHGGMGWSSVVLIRGEGRVALVDTGSFGMRRLLRERLSEHGVQPADVTDLILTHSHYDHCVNFTLFPKARIVIGADELAWATAQPWGESPVPELYVRELKQWPTLAAAADGDTVFPGMSAHLAPGHTPGCLVYVLHGRERDIVFTGDAAKNRAEMVSRGTDMTFDPAQSAASIESIWRYWQQKPGSVLVPGHDVPMTQVDGCTEYLGQRDARVMAWFGDDLETTTVFRLQA
jgi:N-acyl homoserine lactone hydrolase